MKGKRLLMLGSVILLVVILAVTLLGSGCTKPATEAKTLKVGHLCNFGWSLGLDMKRMLDVVVPLYNEKGGLTIGGEKYKIELISYDTKNDPETGRAAAERLVSQDGVKFILGDITADAWLPLTEENKVISINSTPSPAVISPDLNYTFQGSYLNTSLPEVWGWFAENYPEAKTVGGMFPDIMHGHGDAQQLEALFPNLGLELVEVIFYPPDATDFSAFATKMKTVNPQAFCIAGSGPPVDQLQWKAMREAGYEGLFFSYRGLTPGIWAKVTTLDVLNGAIFPLFDYNLDPPLAQVSKDAKAAWIAEYGSWDHPDCVFTITWYMLETALREANSIDTDEVAAVMANGLRFDTILGPAMMISRPDLNNPRTVDALYGMTIATVKGGEVEVIDTISVDEAFEIVKESGAFGVY
jgi:branched-chain amino acid transport system substrate-binding protein